MVRSRDLIIEISVLRYGQHYYLIMNVITYPQPFFNGRGCLTLQYNLRSLSDNEAEVIGNRTQTLHL